MDLPPSLSYTNIFICQLPADLPVFSLLLYSVNTTHPMPEEHPIYRTAQGEEKTADRTILGFGKEEAKAAHSRAKTLFSEHEIKPKKFAGISGYTDEELRLDTERATKIEKGFERSASPESEESKMYADILEAIAFEHGEMSDWFGAKSKVIKTAPFDDYVHGVDMVVETEVSDQETTHLALGVDVTFRNDLFKKFDAIRSRIDKGELGQVKYFLSERPDTARADRVNKIHAGPLQNIPHVVIGAEIDRVKELALLWMNRKNKQLGEHPVQRMILQEIALQLEAFAAYARGIDKNEVAVILERQLQEIQKLQQEKQKAGIKTVAHDKVFDEIKRNLSLFAVPTIKK